MIDLSFLKEITKDNSDLINEFLADFIVEKKLFETKISNSLKDNNGVRIMEISHSFKSSAKIIGITALYHDLDLLERTASKNNWSEIKIIIDRVFETLKESEAELNNLIR